MSRRSQIVEHYGSGGRELVAFGHGGLCIHFNGNFESQISADRYFSHNFNFFLSSTYLPPFSACSPLCRPCTSSWRPATASTSPCLSSPSPVTSFVPLRPRFPPPFLSLTLLRRYVSYSSICLLICDIPSSHWSSNLYTVFFSRTSFNICLCHSPTLSIVTVYDLPSRM